MKHKSVHNCNGCNCNPDVVYHENLKGTSICESEIESNYDGSGNRDGHDKYLYLMEDYSFKVFDYYYNTSNWQDCSSNYELKESETIVEFFKLENIVNGIINQLENRLEKLGSRSKKQKERLEKLEAIKLN